MATETELHFDGWTVNRVTGALTRDGRTMRLQHQPLRILVELADHAGEIVPREQLVKKLWPAGIVDFDNGLNVAVRKLRVALDDVGDVPRYIETLPRVGYRFVGLMASPATAKPRSRILLALTVGTIVVVMVGTAWWTLRGRSNTAPAVAVKHVPSPRALELYLAGIHNRSRRDTNTAELALNEFKAAIQEDPNYPEAWAALGGQYSVMAIRQIIPPAEAIPKALEAVQRALALDPDSSDAHAMLGQIYLGQRNFAAAYLELQRALALNDHSARAWHYLSMWHAHQGHVDEALAAIRRARGLEPMTLLLPGNYALILYSARRYDEAIDFLRPLVESNPHFDQARSTFALALMAKGDLAGAQEQIRLIEDPGLNRSDVGLLYAKLGHRTDALREIEKLEAHGRAGFGVGYDEAIIYAALGELDRGCEALARAVDDHSVLVSWMRLDPRIDPLRDRQCFLDVEKRVYATARGS